MFQLFTTLAELETPHESPSATLARLRVSEEAGDEDHFAGSSSRRPYSSEPYTTWHPSQHNTNPQHNNPLSHPRKPDHEGRRVDIDGSYRDARRRESYSSETTNARPYTSQQSAPEYHRFNHAPSASYPNTTHTYPSRGHHPPASRSYSSGYLSTPPEIFSDLPLMRGTDDEQTPVARYRYPEPGMPSLPTSDDNSMRYECSYCGKGFNRPSSLRV